MTQSQPDNDSPRYQVIGCSAIRALPLSIVAYGSLVHFCSIVRARTYSLVVDSAGSYATDQSAVTLSYARFITIPMQTEISVHSLKYEDNESDSRSIVLLGVLYAVAVMVVLSILTSWEWIIRLLAGFIVGSRLAASFVALPLI